MIARRQQMETIHHYDGVAVITSEGWTEMRVSATDPADAAATGWDRKTFRRPGLEVESTATAELRSTATDLHLDLALDVTRDGAPYWNRRWTKVIPRRLL
jgi:hypothetical protein